MYSKICMYIYIYPQYEYIFFWDIHKEIPIINHHQETWVNRHSSPFLVQGAIWLTRKQGRSSTKHWGVCD